MQARACVHSPPKERWCHGHTYVQPLRRTDASIDTSSSLSAKRLPIRTWHRWQGPSLVRPPMPLLAPEVRWMALSNMKTLRVLRVRMYYRRVCPPLRSTYFGWASRCFWLVQRQATFFYPACYPMRVSNRVLFAPWSRIGNFVLKTAFTKGCPLFRMRRGAGRWQPKQRRPPAVTRNRLRNMPSCPRSMLLSCKGKNNRTE